jgi:hypothetical protein
VLALLALAAWGAAASQRTLVAELRAAAAHAQAAEAFEAAQGGLDFALALLQAGTVNAACLPAPAAGADVSVALQHGPVQAACRRGDDGWECACAALGEPAPLAPGSGVAFRVGLQALPAPGVVQLRAVGCNRSSLSCPPDAAATDASGRAVSRLAVRVHAAPPAGASQAGHPVAPSAPAWRRVPGSWRDF